MSIYDFLNTYFIILQVLNEDLLGNPSLPPFLLGFNRYTTITNFDMRIVYFKQYGKTDEGRQILLGVIL